MPVIEKIPRIEPGAGRMTAHVREILGWHESDNPVMRTNLTDSSIMTVLRERGNSQACL